LPRLWTTAPRSVASRGFAAHEPTPERTAFVRHEAWNAGVRAVRCRVEKVFGTCKRSYGLRRMRWLGLAKAGLQVRLTATAYNLRRSATILRARAT
jgi:IS5 family transposase